MTATSHADATDLRLIHTLGYAGLLPFVGLAALLWLLPPDLQAWVAIAQAGYAALIASFMGGVHWGMGWRAAHTTTTGNHSPAGAQPSTDMLAQRSHFLWGVVPSLLAWPGLLMPAFAGLPWLGFVLVLCYLADRTLYPRAGLGHWLTLRFRLTAVAALSCFIGAGAL